ncbi:thioredoxin family protein [Streptomyces sp. SKN60]|uniref:thioredoxin family protein n=1 Tax=Streptomyces sp. SKN60 TaxID=2855506 RepID=UPI00224627EA|nr:thioredoxin family protein [Streptomyces sp. SKN60]MCX2181300.1 thioredoxin family protein [Streptomyces sp. SKN60]
MEIELLYCAGCPNWAVAQMRLNEALETVGRLPDSLVRLRAVETDEDARALHFSGSPTILIDGRDPFPAPAGSYGLTCRVYPTPDGLAGAPTVHQLVRALTDFA